MANSVVTTAAIVVTTAATAVMTVEMTTLDKVAEEAMLPLQERGAAMVVAAGLLCRG
jgi:hypothetical protein